MTGVAKGAVFKLLVDLGKACEENQRRTLVSLKARRIQCDEIWSFCYAKEKNVPIGKRWQFWYGDVYTWTALDAVARGRTDAGYAFEFMRDVVARLV